MEIKEGASLQGLNVTMRPVLIEWEKLCKKYNVEAVVTCGTDGAHSAGSMHYYGYALDLRTRDMTEGQKQTARQNMAVKLGLAYDVVLHRSHMHIEYKIGGF